MPFFAVGVIGPSGDISPLTFSAETAEEAKRLSGVPESRIEWVRRAWAVEFRKAVKARKLSLQTQSIFLMTLGSLALSGQEVSKTFRELCQRFGIALDADVPGASLSERVQAIGLHPIAILLIQVGQISGNIGESLVNASEELRRLATLQAGVMRSILPGLAYLFMGVFVTALVPLLMMPVFERVEAGAVKVQRNFMTEVASALEVVYGDLWWVLLLAVVAAFVFRDKLLPFARKARVPIVRKFDEWRILRRGMFFAFGYRPLLAAGITQRETLERMSEMVPRKDRGLYEQLIDGVRRGRAISDLINTEEWPHTLRAGLSGFEQSKLEVRVRVLDNLAAGLKIEDEALGLQIGRVILIIGLLLLASGLVMMLVGIVMPLYMVQIR